MRGRPPIDPMVRLMSRIEPDLNSGCWLWSGSVDSCGYGTCGIGSRIDGTRGSSRMHRLSWVLHRSPIPQHLKVLHRCDTPGSHHPNAKITEDDVRAIRAGGEATASLAARYGMSTGAIAGIRAGRKWRHVDAPGSAPPSRKLTPAAVREIRGSSESNAVLGRRFGVRSSHIWLIRQGAQWKGIGQADDQLNDEWQD